RADLEGDRHLRHDGGPVHQGRGGWPGGRALQVGAGQLPDARARLRQPLAGPTDHPQRAAAWRRSLRGTGMNELLHYCPRPRTWPLDWPALHDAYAWIRDLDGCPQDPISHAEGNAGILPRMVCEALAELSAWRNLPADERAVVFLATLLHDVAKPACTR